MQSLRDRFDDFERDGALRYHGATQYSLQNQRMRRANVLWTVVGHLKFSAHLRTALEAIHCLPVIDLLIAATSSRLKAYREIRNRFGVLSLLDQLSADEVRFAATKLFDTYPTDFEYGFGDEMIQFREFVELLRDEKQDRCSIEKFMYEIIIDINLKYTFPTVEIMLLIYLCL
jgi:hypothetical protein